MMLMILKSRECKKLYNFFSHNFKFQVIEDLRDNSVNEFESSCVSQNNNMILFYKHCGIGKRLNGVNLLESFSPTKWR